MTNSNYKDSADPGFSYILNVKPGFPANLFRFKEYNAPKIIAAFLLLISFAYFTSSFISLLSNHNSSYSTIGNPTFWSVSLRSLFTSITQLFRSLIDIFNIFIMATPLMLSFFIAWTVFAPRDVAMYILSFTNMVLGVLEILNPFDLIPDFLPIMGSLDDSVLGGGLIGYGSYLFFSAVRNRDKVNTVIELINDKSEEKALQILLEQQGIAIKKIEKN